MLRNVAGQAIGSQMLDVNTGQAFIGPVTVYVTGDGGTQSIGIVSGGACEHEGNGYYSYKPSQAETNYRVIAFTFIGPLAIPASVTVQTITEAQAAAIASATITTVIGDGPTRTELLNQLAHRLNKTPPPNMDSSTEARLGSYLNQRQRRLLSMPGLARLRDATISFGSLAEQRQYGVPGISKISRIYETTNERVLYELSAQDYRLIDPNPMSGTPEAYVWIGRQVVMQQPLRPTALWVVSSHDADRGLVQIEGVVSGGSPKRITVALHGLTPVSAATLVTDWVRVDKCYLGLPAVGDVTLKDDDARVLSVIPAEAITSVYTGLVLWPTPSAPITYYADVTRTVSDLVHGTDQAAIPDDFTDLLVLGALADEYQHLSDPRWSTAMTEYKERENQLKYWLAETAIGRPFALTRGWQSPSQLGGMFPAGS